MIEHDSWYAEIMKTLTQILTEICLILFYPVIGLLSHTKSYPVRNSNGKCIVIIERWLRPNILHILGKQYLESHGYTVYLVSHSIIKGSFYQSAKKLDEFIKKNNLEQITLVGISSGGISALIYFQELEGWKNVNNLITIGTPFRGTLAALPLSVIKACREILPWSVTVQKIKSTQIEQFQKVVCIVAKVDELVPRWSSTLPKTNTEVINVIGHNALHLVCRDTYDTILKYAKKS